jgi:hypothetical protein
MTIFCDFPNEKIPNTDLWVGDDNNFLRGDNWLGGSPNGGFNYN